MQILVVEDHTDTRSILALLLSRCGCRTVTAKNIKEARQRLEEMQFRILISDLNLPDGDGVDLVRQAKKMQPNLKAIAVTGRTSEEERALGMEAGFDCYLTKPVDYLRLREAIKV